MSQTYEEMIRELRELVRKMDDTGTSLDESIALYERGMHLIQACEAILTNAELKISSLTERSQSSPP